MSLANIHRGTGRGPQRIVLYGVEGIGKTTWAAGAPAPVFLGTEDGFGDLDAPRFPAPGSWSEVIDAVESLIREPHTYRTLVIDTLDHLERLVWDQVKRSAKEDSIEAVGGGFGKGYVYAAEEFGRLATALDTLRNRRRMHIIGLAHAHVRTFQNPDGSNFDRYELRMHSKAAALWKEWPDVLLFANLDVRVATTEWREEKKALAKGKATGDRRRVYTSKSPAYDAKNRYSLPDEIDLSWAAFANAIGIDAIEARIRGQSAPPASSTPGPVDEARRALADAVKAGRLTNEAASALVASHGAARVADLTPEGLLALRAEIAALGSAPRATETPPAKTTSTVPDAAIAHPSWLAECAEPENLLTILPNLGLTYDAVAAWCDAHQKPRPAAMDAETRHNLGMWVVRQGGRDRILGWLGQVSTAQAAK